MALSGLANRAASGIDQREVEDVLEGSFAAEQRPLSRSVRLYISSEFSDSRCEKQYLWEKVIPELRQFCQTLGLQFHAVDLFRSLPRGLPCTTSSSSSEGEGEREGEGGDRLLYLLELQGALQLALKEIKLCQRVSAGPTFVSFLAQRYGHKQLHLSIPEEELRLLLAAVDAASARKLILECYKLDRNALPPVYVLQPCKKLQSQPDVEEWVETHNALCKAIRKAAKVALGKDFSKVQKYTMSVVEEEVTSGIFNLSGDPNQCCFWFKRTFTDLVEQKPASDPAVSIFTDVTPGKRGLEFDSESMKTLNHLKEARMPAKYVGLDASNIFEFQLKWRRNKGLDVAGFNPTHSDYLTELGESFSTALRSKIADCAELLELQAASPLYQEVLSHGAYCKEAASSYMDRPEISSKITRYLEAPSRVPLVLYGECGSGKTAVMASTGYHHARAGARKRTVVVARFLGTTPASSTIRHTLRSICQQLSHVYDEDEADIPTDYKGLACHFSELLHRASAERPLLVLLDGVDQLSPEDGASGMSWLPLALPTTHVKIVLSTSSDVHRRCFPVLQSLLAKHTENIVEVPPLSQEECPALLQHWLSSAGRSLLPVQAEAVLAAFQRCPLPLYLRLVMREVLSWSSYHLPQWRRTPGHTITEVIDVLFEELEAKHGRVLVSHTLAYLSPSRFGLTESELLDTLACDEEVMAEVWQRWEPRLPSLPPLLWSGLHHDLLLAPPGLLELRVGVGQTLVLRWSHRCLLEAAEQRYLGRGGGGEEGGEGRRYGLLADYFSGELAGRLRESVSRDGDSTLQSDISNSPPSPPPPPPPPPPAISSQPLLLNAEERLYNVRKLAELPHCLARSGRWSQLESLLTSYSWLQAAISTASLSDIISSFQLILHTVPLGRRGSSPHEFELRLLRDALQLSSGVLVRDPAQLSSQLLGRLWPFLLQEEQQSVPLLKAIVIQALQDSQSPFYPLHPLVGVPGGPQLVAMEGHRDEVSCLATAATTTLDGAEPSLCILSASWDKTVRSWDLESTGVLKTFDGHSGRVLSVAITSDALYAVSSSEDTTVRHWHVPSSRCLHVMEGHLAAVGAVVISSDGAKTISASNDTTVKIWNTDINSSLCGQLIFTLRVHRGPVLALALLRDTVLASGGRDGVVLLTNIVSGGVLKTLDGHTSAVTALALTEVDGRCFVVSGSEDCGIRVWGTENGELVHSLHTAAAAAGAGGVKGIAVGPNGKIIACHSNIKVVSVWDLLTGVHLFNLAGHSGAVCSVCVAAEGRLAITGAADNTIRIWDLQSPPVSRQTRLHTSGNVRSVAISPCGTYGVSTGGDAVVKIFELDSLIVLRELRGHCEAISQVFILRDSQKLLTASFDKTIRLWDGRSMETMQCFEGHEKAVTCVALSIDGKLLMSGGEDCRIIFWNLKTGENLKSFSNHKAPIVSVAFAQNASSYYMISASSDGVVCVRDFYTAQILLSASTHTGKLLCLDASPNALFLATGSADNSAQILGLPNGRLDTVLLGHKKSVTAVRVLSGCEKCLTASEDCSLRIWGVADGECLATFHTDVPVVSCDISRGLTVLYGMQKGWVSTACYDPDIIGGEKPHPLLKKLQGAASASASSFTDSEITSHSTEQDEAAIGVIDQPNAGGMEDIDHDDDDVADDSSTETQEVGCVNGTTTTTTNKQQTTTNPGTQTLISPAHEWREASEMPPPHASAEEEEEEKEEGEITAPDDSFSTDLASKSQRDNCNGRYTTQHSASLAQYDRQLLPSGEDREKQGNGSLEGPDSDKVGGETHKTEKSVTCSIL